jgi:hypothetical protein
MFYHFFNEVKVCVVTINILHNINVFSNTIEEYSKQKNKLKGLQ